MTPHFENRVVRPIRVFARGLTLDGLLNVSLGGRTLDELNAASRPALALTSALVVAGDWTIGDGPILIHKAAILCVTEIPDLGARLPGGRAEPEIRRFGRSAIRLRLEDWTIEAYVHTSHGSDPLARLSQAGHPFIALNAATLTGPGIDLSVPFLAVNRTHVLAAQELWSVDAVADEAPGAAGGAG